MIRPKKTVIDEKNFYPNKMADDMLSAGDLIIGSNSSIDGTACYNEYFKPEIAVMTETVFALIMKHRDSHHYLNNYDVGMEGWKFCGLPIAVIRQSGSLREEWYQFV